MTRKCYVIVSQWEDPSQAAPVLWAKQEYSEKPKKRKQGSPGHVRIPVAVMEWDEYERLIRSQ